MFVETFQTGWESELALWQETLADGARLVLFIDGAFVPGLFRELGDGSKRVLLFESLPGCSDEARDVSPFLTHYDPLDGALARVLEQCNGWPMVSVIATFESIERLGERLAAWCVVEVDGQRFNFRFPDTRRLPAIFEAMTSQQRNEFLGGALSWHYIGRDGSWRSLPFEPKVAAAPIADRVQLDNEQFSQLVKDSEADEMWVRLLDRGVRSELPPSQRHALLAAALSIAEVGGLDDVLTIRWCGECLGTGQSIDGETVRTMFAEWQKGYARDGNEVLYRTV